MYPFVDKNGVKLEVMQIVNVPDPIADDIHNHEFQGTVADILDNGNVIVEDGDSDFFEIEGYRLEVEVD